jgi:hypothetical protein
MFRISIKKDNIETNAAEFETELLCETWKSGNHEFFPEGYTFLIQNVSEKKQFEADEMTGLKFQKIGKKVLAKIHAINVQKIRLGMLSTENIVEMLNDQSIINIERFLLNGYLSRAVSMINAMPDNYFSSEHKQLILNYIEENK